MNYNKITVVGRMTRDPELRTTTSGQTLCSFSVATNRDWKDKSGQKQSKTEFFNVVIWGKLAEVAGQYLQKGQEVLVEGRMESRKYVDRDNVERTVWDLVADGMQMGSKAANSAQGQAQRPAPAQDEQPAPKEDLPTISLDDQEDEVRIEDVPF